MGRMIFIAVVVILVIFSAYLFVSVYLKVKEKAIDDLNRSQKIHARQAAKGIEGFIEYQFSLLDSLTKVESIIDVSPEGKRFMDLILLNNTKNIRNITRMSRSGRILYTAPFDQRSIGSDISSQEHVKEILRTHKPVVSDVFKAVQGYTAIGIHVPVYKKDVFDGTLGILIPFDEIAKRYLSDIAIGRTGYAWLISRKGIELYCPIPGHVGRSVFENCKEFPEILTMAREMLERKEGTAVYSYDHIREKKHINIKKHAAYLPINIGNTFWSIVVATSEDEVLNTLKGFRNRLLFIVCLFLMVGLTSSYYILRATLIISEENKRKETEDALRLTQLAVDASSDAIFWHRPGSKFFNVNEAACRSLGYTKKELLAMDVYDVDPDFTLEKEKTVIAVMKKDGWERKESRHRTKEGKLFPVEVTSNVFRKGDEEYVVSIARDISERKAIENELRSSMEKFQKILLMSPDAIIIATNKDGRVVETNMAFENVTDYSREEANGKTVSELNIWVDPRRREEFIKMHDDQGTVRDFEADIRTKSGKIKNCSLSSELLELAGEVHAITVFRDITEQKRLVNQLLQSQKMEAIGHLAGGVAHDFNNILTAIIGYGEVLKQKMGDDSPLHRYVDYILTSAGKAANLTQSLLAFGRKQIIKPQAFELNNIIRNISLLVRRLIGEDIELKTLFYSSDLIVNADIGQMEQVIVNLATNARDAMPDGGILTIKTGKGSINKDILKEQDAVGEETNYALLTVEDTGRGMNEETLRNIFEPFFTTKEVGKGTGLGLSTVYGIVTQHKGYVTASSEPGRGSSFTIYLPLAETATPVQEKVKYPKLLGGTETILLAEDDPGIMDLMKYALREYGYKVFTARDGEEAIKQFREHKEEIDCIVMDVIMPKVNGREASETIRKENSSVKVIFISGYPGDLLQQRGILQEGVNLIYKPVSPKVLLERIRMILEEKC